MYLIKFDGYDMMKLGRRRKVACEMGYHETG